MAVAASSSPFHAVLPPYPTGATTSKTEWRISPALLRQCSNLRDLGQAHACLVKAGLFPSHPSAVEHLLAAAALAIPGGLPYAMEVFHHVPDLSTSAHNVIIRGLTSDGYLMDVLSLFRTMLVDSAEADKYTFSCVLKACSRLMALEVGEQMHAQVEKAGFASQQFVRNSLIHMYANCGQIGPSRKLFDGIPAKGLVTWNAMFAGYSRNGEWNEVVSLFLQMLKLGVPFDDVTLVTVLTACGRLRRLDLGEWIDAHVEANRTKHRVNLITSLVDMYAKCGQVDRARSLFDEMPVKDVVAWSAMISGYLQVDMGREALALFQEMQVANVAPNEVTMVSVLSACAALGALETGKWVHSFIKRKKLELTVNLGTALVDFFAKCGCIDSAIDVFALMPRKNVLSWTVLIQGLASNGRGKEALELFSLMLEAETRPNDVTLIAVLSACSHTGLVDEGWRIFMSMKRDYGIEPKIDHYGCMVDTLSRAGLVLEAYQFIKDMPIQPNAVLWRTLLASCKIHKNVEIGEVALRQIVGLEASQSGDYILLSNIYASVGLLDDAFKIRSQMEERKIRKTPGCSLIEVDGMIHEFFADDREHPVLNHIYKMVDQIIEKIRLVGYVPNIEDARLGAEEEEKEASVSRHSEKLAIAFGLLKTSPGTTIRVFKNLRVCTDCHSATKMISKIYNREIVMRDRNRFHRFKDGSCSCMDFW